MNNYQKPKTILYGAGSSSIKRFSYINLEYDLIGVCDKNPEKEQHINAVWNKPFISPQTITDYTFDCILISSTFENEIRQYLLGDLEIPIEKIKSATAECELWMKKGYHSFGELNPDKVFYVIQRGVPSYGNGLMANVLVTMIAMRYALEQNYIPIVDMKNYYNINMEIEMLGKINTWEQYFQQPSKNITLEEVYQSKYVVYSDLSMDTLKIRQPDFYPYEELVFNKKINDYYHDMYVRYLGLADGIEEKLEIEYNNLFSNSHSHILGVCLRGTDYTKSKPFLHFIQPNLEVLGNKVEEFMNKYPIDYIYVTSDEKKSIEYFQQRFPQKVCHLEHPFFDIFHSTDAETLSEIHFARKNDAYLRGLEYLISVLLLARCDYLVAGRCSAVSVAQIINNHFKDKYIFDLGRYGINDDCYLWSPLNRPLYIKGINS